MNIINDSHPVYSHCLLRLDCTSLILIPNDSWPAVFPSLANINCLDTFDSNAHINFAKSLVTRQLRVCAFKHACHFDSIENFSQSSFDKALRNRF